MVVALRSMTLSVSKGSAAPWGITVLAKFGPHGGLMVCNFDSCAYACRLSPAWSTVHKRPLAHLFTLSFFVLSHQHLMMRVLDIDVET